MFFFPPFFLSLFIARFILPVIKLQVIKDPDLRERHLGDLQGLVYGQAARQNPIAFKAFLSERADQEIPVS